MATAADTLLTAEEFARRPDPGHPEDFVRGRVVPLPQPTRRHGQICSRVVRILGHFVDEHDLGHVLSNDSAVITERNPDTVRGADVAFYSYERLPKGPLPPGYGPEVPEFVVEVLSPSERWPRILAKAASSLEAGVSLVLVLDDERRSAHLFGADGTTRMLASDEELEMPQVLGEFRVLVGRLFE